MKRYLVFSGDQYYPNGGWSDFVGSLESEEVALSVARANKARGADWFQVVDTATMEAIHEDYSRAGQGGEEAGR